MCSHLLCAVEASWVCQGVVSCIQSWCCCEGTTLERKRPFHLCTQQILNHWIRTTANSDWKRNVVLLGGKYYLLVKKSCLWWWTEGGLRECSQEWPYLSPLPPLSLIGSGLMNDGGGREAGEGWTEPARKAVRACRMWGRQETAVCELLKSGVQRRRRERWMHWNRGGGWCWGWVLELHKRSIGDFADET